MLVSVEDFFEGGHSICRNSALHKMFEMIGGGERAGSGADTIKKGCADNKWPAPEIKEHFGQNDDRVELTLRLVQSTSSPKKETESGLKSGQKIVELMRKNPSITIAELVAELGMSRSGVNKQIAKLKAEGVIEREGADKGGYWVVWKIPSKVVPSFRT